MEQFATWGKFENDVVILLGFGKVDELDDVGVVQLAHNLDFFQNVGPLRGRVSIGKNSSADEQSQLHAKHKQIQATCKLVNWNRDKEENCAHLCCFRALEFRV